MERFNGVIIPEYYIKTYFEYVKRLLPHFVVYFGYYEETRECISERVITIYYTHGVYSDVPTTLKPYGLPTTSSFKVSASKMMELLQYVET